MTELVRTLHASAMKALREGALLEAVRQIEAARAVRPDDHAVLNDAAAIYQRAGHLDVARGCLTAALRGAPNSIALRNNMTVLRRLSGDLAGALESAEVAVALAPADADAAFQLATTLARLARHQDAVARFRCASRRAPDRLDVATGLGASLLAIGDVAGAVAVYRAFLVHVPDDPSALNNLGNVLLNQTDPRAAIACFDKALRLDPTSAAIRYNRALARLSVGDLEGGWADHRFRWLLSNPPSPVQLFQRNLPEWDGSNLNGRRLLLHAEQGLGDTLQFVRFAAMARRRGLTLSGSVVLLVQGPLRRLCAELAAAGAVEAVSDDTMPAPGADVHLPLMDLPRVLGLDISELWAGPYLRPSHRQRSKLRRRIGVVWAGNPGHSNDARRSMPVSHVRELVAGLDAVFVSLQVGVRAAEAQGLGLATLPPPGDFQDTAERISDLDLVISVDTSTAHLAGALGCPVWLLLPHAPDWRWMHGRSDTPWYPSMRLFRQPQPGDWAAVCRDVRAALG